MKTDNIKEIVKNKYSEIALLNTVNGCCCCGDGNKDSFDYTVMSDDYSQIEGYVNDADLGLGCGIPVEYANIRKGDTVLDLGSGAGNDIFIARKIAGESGRLIGLDFTDEMINKAKANQDKLGYKNIEFIKGDIENIPIDDNSVDVVISNCVLNLVPDKHKAFSEIYRVLKADGHFCISDIVIKGKLPENLKSVAAFYTGCVSGALEINDYLDIISESNFADINIKKEKQIIIPDKFLLEHLKQEEFDTFKNSDTEILSITVVANKL